MKKLLALMSTLVLTGTASMSVIACKQEDLDENLNLIYKGKTVHNISEFDLSNIKWEIIPVNSEKKVIKKYVISELDKIKFQDIIAKNIVSKEFKDKNLVWFNQETKSSTKCYDFKVKNFTEEENGDISWIFNQVNGRINVQISYFVGMTTLEKTFDAKQKIDMTYEIKVGETESDKIIEKWQTQFEKLAIEWNEINPLEIKLEKNDYSKINNKMKYSDLSSSIKRKINNEIKKIIENMRDDENHYFNISYNLDDINNPFGVKNKLLELKINANLNDSISKDIIFSIKFIN